MTSSSPESSQELRYPPVHIDQSLDRVDLNTLIMRSSAHSVPEEPTSLEDSTYEVLRFSDSVYETSDDEGHTASVASTPDDASTFSDDDDDDDFPHGYVDEYAQAVDGRELDLPAAEALDDSTMPGGEDSTLTETPYLGQSESTRLIRMNEEQSADHDGVDACGLAKEFTPAQISDLKVLKSYGRSDLRLTVRAALSERFLPVDVSFKVLYVGNVEAWYKKEIESRLHAALNASPGPSRSIMMRGQMEPYGPVLSANHCTNIKPLEKTGKESGVVITLDDGTDLTFDSQRTHHVDSAHLPDLVIFWYPQPNLPAPEVNKFPTACEAFERCQIPCLHLALDRRFHLHSEGFTGDKNLRVCVEGRDDSVSDFKQQESIPIDVYTFLNLDPAQLNRHLAAISPRAISPGSPKPTTAAKRWNLGTLMPSSKNGILESMLSPGSIPLKVVLAFVALSILSIIGTTYVAPSYNMARVEVESPISITSWATTPTPISALTTSSSQPVESVTPLAPVKVTPRDLTVVPPPQEPSQRRQDRKKDKVCGFEIQTTGEHQFVLSPSQEFISRKRKPQLQIQVSRNLKSIPIRYVRTMEGVYIVDLEQEYPVGFFNVSIATHSKPLMQQSFAITMGYNKSGVGRFFDIIQREFATMKQDLRNLSSTLPKRVQLELARMEDRTFDWRKTMCHSRHEATSHLKAAKKEAKRQLAVGKSLLREVSGDAWMSLRKATAPARTSRAALRARNNAFRLRCGFERAIGLSSWTKEGKKSRSCKKIGW